MKISRLDWSHVTYHELRFYSWCTSFWLRNAGYLLIRRFSKYFLILHNCECKILKWGLRHLEGSWLWKKSKWYPREPASIYLSGSGWDMWKCCWVWSSVTLCPPISVNKWDWLNCPWDPPWYISLPSVGKFLPLNY